MSGPTPPPEVECPRCGPGWRRLHERNFLVLRRDKHGRLICVTAEAERDLDAAGAFMDRRHPEALQ